mmetsp:Transcript_12639/g.18614  ORF Transcript_12639/g.18614 Transcript_12639/m.18614 type:complete len:217 (-) Transcript_12639:220-870(-)
MESTDADKNKYQAPRMLVELTPALNSFFSDIISGFPPDERKDMESKLDVEQGASVSMLKVAVEASEERQQPCNLKELLKGSQLTFPRPKPPPPAQGVEERRQHLQALAQQKEYNRMVANLAPGPAGVLGVQDTKASLKFSFGVAGNIIVAVFSAFVIGWALGRNLFADKPQHAVSLGLVLAMVMLIVEMTLFIIRAVASEANEMKQQQLVAGAEKR